MAQAPVDPQAIRLKLGMTQEQFALRFGLELRALQSRQQGRRTPDRAISAYLRVIERDPESAARAQEHSLSASTTPRAPT
ncbi:MAG: hypothetical protein F9K29_03350 [Hyphomicrobiaceae bacterium]|nr:MAG: hypothetical protein F9K29_03350 [Hyphomicrobiaceae bacterium]